MKEVNQTVKLIRVVLVVLVDLIIIAWVVLAVALEDKLIINNRERLNLDFYSIFSYYFSI